MENELINENLNSLNLETLNDHQKMLLSQLSYVDINEEGRKLIAEGSITLYELRNYIIKPNQAFMAGTDIDEKSTEIVGNIVMGEGNIDSDIGIVDKLIDLGLGDLKITNVSDEKKGVFSTGFQALTFEDSVGNIGISYRGSDFDFSHGALREWTESNFLEYFKNDSPQRKEALKYFENNKTVNGKNFVYGYSLGGNLTSHVYAEHHEEIAEAFTINGNPINEKLLDTPEKVAAFNDPKYNCNIVCVDLVGHLKSAESYEQNIHYIQNNGTGPSDNIFSSILSAHSLSSASFDEEGNFVKVSKEEMVASMYPAEQAIVIVVQSIKKILNEIETEKEDQAAARKASFESYKQSVLDHFNKKLKLFNINYKLEENPSSEERLEEIIALKSELEEHRDVLLGVMNEQDNNSSMGM